ncbi:heavy-metal-associated domain-containing protein [Streptomyces sp. NPDC004059]
MGSTTFKVEGMACAHCRHAVTEQIADVHNAGSVTAALSSATVTVTVSRPMDHSDIAAVVDEAGIVVVP